MSISTDQSIDDLVNGLSDNISSTFSPFTDPSLEQYFETLTSSEEFENILSPSLFSSDMNTQTPSGFSPENQSNSNHQEVSNIVSQAVAVPANDQSNIQRLEIIAQPFYGLRLRYRSDYEKNKNRLGVLKNRNTDSSYQGPAIRIPECYLNPNDEFYIRVALVTVKYDKTNLHYFHLYELEHPTNEECNDRENNAVWFSIQGEDYTTGIKSFPLLRIVKKRESDLKNSGNLRVFDCHDQNLQNNFLSQFSSAKDTIREYNLDRCQLAFTIGKKLTINGEASKVPYPDTTAFSEEMVEGAGKESDGDNDIQSTTERPILPPSDYRVYKYAPRYGFDASSEDMVIFLTKKFDQRKYGELNIRFECDILNGRWSESIANLDIKDRMISFKTPIFPHPFEMIQSVDVILRDNNHVFETIKYFYLSTVDSCSRCQLNIVDNRTNVVPNVPNKRPAFMMDTYRDQMYDGIVPVPENSHELQQSLSEPSQKPFSSSTTASNFASLPAIDITQTTEDPHEKIMTVLSDSIKSLFVNNDDTQFLRICRSFIKKSPQLLHETLDNNHSDLLLKFIPIAFIDTLQQKNELGETILVHAIRLNRTEIIKALLERKYSEILIENIDEKNNNIFHIAVLNSTLSEIFDLLINHFLEKSIDIQQKFDQMNQDYQTPLQLAIYKNNLTATKSLLKHFNTNVCETKNRTGDNLIHLAIRYGDLTMVKYLIEEGKLIQQGNQSNLTMTPSELARSLKRDDIIKYLNELYLQQEIDEDNSSDEDDD